MPDAPEESWRPPALVLRVTAWVACLVVLGGGAYLAVQLLSALRLVLIPVVLAVFLTRVLSIPAGWLRRHGWRPAPAAAVSLFGMLLALAGIIGLIAPPMVDEFEDLGPTIDEGLQEIEDWLVEDSGFDVTHEDIEDVKDDIEERGREALEESQDTVVEGARALLAGIAGLILALILAFFFVKDGPRFQRLALRVVPPHRRDGVSRACRAAWASLGGYLRGAAILGIVESIIIGTAMFLTGSGLVLPVMVLTFLAAFVPLVGATVAGIIAVLVTLAAGGFVPALIVGAVVIVVQQLDNDLLAPWIYGRSLSLHPAAILVSITAGTALFGFVGTILAVPTVAVVVNAWAAVDPSFARVARIIGGTHVDEDEDLEEAADAPVDDGPEEAVDPEAPSSGSSP